MSRMPAAPLPAPLPLLLPLLFAGALILTAPAHAQTDGLNGGAGGSDDLQQLLDDLDALIEKGEKERLADPWFLKDLRDLTARYDNPWQTLLYSEGFTSGGRPPAPWRVVEGDFRVERRFGLRARVQAKAPPPEDTAPESNTSQQQDSDPGKQLFGAILQGVLEGQKKKSTNDTTVPAPAEPGSAQPDPAQPALAVAEQPLSNAFSGRFEVSGRSLADGAALNFELGVYQSDSQGNHPGYRLSYDVRDGGIALLRISSRGGRALIETAESPAPLDDDANHIVTWQRYPDGRMTVAIDGTPVMETLDRGFRDTWSGLLVETRSGDFALRAVTVHGTSE